MGQFAEYDEVGGSDVDGKIVEDNPGVDILQVAHLHITVNDRIGETPVVGVRNSGREIARIDVTLAPGASRIFPPTSWIWPTTRPVKRSVRSLS